MNVTFSTVQPTFKSHIKGLYKEGKLPMVKYDLYGDYLTKENVTDEHVIPKSKGGSSSEGKLHLQRSKTILNGVINRLKTS